MPPRPSGLGGVLERHSGAAGRITHEGFPEGKIFSDREFALHRIAVAEIVAEFARTGRLSGRHSVQRTVPFSAARRPARTRSSVDFPDPFGPVTTRASSGLENEGNVVENQVLAALRS